MLSVDLGLVSLLSHLPGETQLTLFDARKPMRLEGNPISLTYQRLQSIDELMEFDCVIHWGDFTHWLRYGKWDWLQGRDRKGASAPELVDQWYRLFLLERDAERLAAKLIVFGNSLYGLSALDLTDARYDKALSVLYGSARLVMPRDQVTASVVDQLSPRHAPALGCDCAFLLDPDQTLPMKQAVESIGGLPERFLICAFGRSGEAEALMRFAQALGKRLGIQVVALDWLGVPQGLPGLAVKLAMLRRASALVTDIYHLAVSGMRETVPTIGIGRARSYAAGTLDDKKKEILFRQMMAGDYYLYLEDVLESGAHPPLSRNSLDTAEAFLRNRPALDRVNSWVRSQVANARHRLLASISACAG